MSGPRQHTQPVQERSEPAVTIEVVNTLTAHACGVFDVRLSAEWRDRPTHDALAAEIEEAIRAVLQKRAKL